MKPVEAVCNHCGRSMPLTYEFWYADHSRPGKFRMPCRECCLGRAKRHYEQHRDETRSKQREWYQDHAEEVHKKRRKYREQNRDAINERQRLDYQRHRRKRLARRRASYKENPEPAKEAAQRYRDEHREEIREKDRSPRRRAANRESLRRRYRENPEHRRALTRHWRQNNPEATQAIQQRSYRKNHERILEYQRQYRRRYPDRVRAWANGRRASELGAQGEFVEADILWLYALQSGWCAYCGVDLSETGYHIDHIIPLSRGGSNWLANLFVACPTCNLSKSSKTPFEWLDMQGER